MMSLGKLSRSRSSTVCPAWANSMAVGAPATLAPTTITSYINRLPLHAECACLRGSYQRQPALQGALIAQFAQVARGSGPRDYVTVSQARSATLPPTGRNHYPGGGAVHHLSRKPRVECVTPTRVRGLRDVKPPNTYTVDTERQRYTSTKGEDYRL